MIQKTVVEPSSQQAVAGASLDGAASSSFWVTPSQDVVWQHFVTSSAITFPLHTHPEYNIVICLNGAVEVRQCGEVQVAERGEALVGNARIPHQSAYLPEDENCEAISLTITLGFLRDVLSDRSYRRPASKSFPLIVGKINSYAIGAIAQTARESLLHKEKVDSIQFELLAQQLILEVFGKNPHRHTYESSLSREGSFLPRWQYVKSHELMMTTANDAFTIDRVARSLGMSPGRFHYLFRSSTGTSPAQYFSQILMAKASRQLSHSADSVKEISYNLGFASPSHFCSSFKRRFGMSPLDFRYLSRKGQTQ